MDRYPSKRTYLHPSFSESRGFVETTAFHTPMIIASASSPASWPQGIDQILTGAYLLLIISLPLLGYTFMVLDFRRYLRSLRRSLVTVVQVVPTTPIWALRQRPSCLKALDLCLPCSEEDVMTAYRELAKTLHPDRGGDLEKFLRLQRHFEQALRLVRSQATKSTIR